MKEAPAKTGAAIPKGNTPAGQKQVFAPPSLRLLFKRHAAPLLALAAAGVFYGLLGCPIKYFTGLSCPGCGASRALWCALTLRFGKALYYHPLFWLIPPALLLLLPAAQKFRRLRAVFLTAAATAFLAVWLLRLFVFRGGVVGWAPPGIARSLAELFSL